MKAFMRIILLVLWFALASYLSERGITQFIANTMILFAGLWAGYQDGKKAGKRELLTGSTK